VKLTHKKQVQGLFYETIRGALAEDFVYTSKQEVEDVIKGLQTLVNTLEVDDVYFGDEE
jgi:hypothetical protein